MARKFSYFIIMVLALALFIVGCKQKGAEQAESEKDAEVGTNNLNKSEGAKE